MTTALIITPQIGFANTYGSNVTFDEDEVQKCIIGKPQTYVLQESQKQQPFIFDQLKATFLSTGVERMIIEIDIRHHYSTTKPKLDSLYGYKRAFKVYYKYIDDSTAFKICLLDPEYTEEYVFGEESVIITKIKFYETTGWIT